MARIFLSYRRRDSAGHAGRLNDRLVAEFGADEVFFDVDQGRLGTRFDERVASALTACDALVAVIGPQWTTIEGDDGRRRLDDPDDLVRRELATALGRGVTVIPVLVHGAGVPAPRELPGELAALSLHESLELSDTRWEYDVGRLVQALRDALAAEALAPHCRTVARSLADDRLLVVLGSSGRTGFGVPSLLGFFGETRIHDVLAALPAILRRKGLDARFVLATSEPGSALEDAFGAAGERFGTPADSLTGWDPAEGYVPPPRTMIHRLAVPIEPLLLEPGLLMRPPFAGVPVELSIRMHASDVLFLGGGEEDRVVAPLVEQRRSLSSGAAWVAGVPPDIRGWWEEHGVEVVRADLAEYGLALRRQVEALPPAG